MLTDPFGTNRITHAIAGCAIRVHSVTGPGVYEAIYAECLQYELREAGLSFEVNRGEPLIYKGVRLKAKNYLDLVVEGLVVAELKSVAMLLAIHKKQLLSQLRLTNLPVGLLINFNVALLSDGGIKRIINGAYKGTAVAPLQPLETGDELGRAPIPMRIKTVWAPFTSVVFVASF